MDRHYPQNYTRRILLAVTGLSPQIVTETLYALTIKQQPIFIPTEIHLITTWEGAERAKLALLSSEPGWFHKFRQDYSLTGIRFDETQIHAVTNASGEILSDIRTPDDNRNVADFITEKVRQLTLDAESALHVSIAGGRKTMGFYLGYALSLYGRPQDRLSHVLVSEPFESSWDFFYPTLYSHVITTKDNKLVDTQNAIVTLAEIPFVSLRHALDTGLQEGTASFSEAVASVQRALEPPRLRIDLQNQRCLAGNKTFTLPPKTLALLSLFARRAIDGKAALPAPPKGTENQKLYDLEWSERFLKEYRTIRNGMLDDKDRIENALTKGMEGDYFSIAKSELHKQLKKHLGIAAQNYFINDGNVRPGRYSLKLKPEAIEYGVIEDDKLVKEPETSPKA